MIQPDGGAARSEKEDITMMVPSIFNDSFVDRFFDDDFFAFPFVGYRRNDDLMRTDVKETNDTYELQISLPGVKKEDIHAELKDGYLTVTAETSKNADQKDSEGRYLRRERYSGSQSRRFYVGEDVKQEDIHAKYENGVLTMSVAKPEQEVVPAKTYISIE